eukprot:2792577-Amphidinium_carterae.1
MTKEKDATNQPEMIAFVLSYNVVLLNMKSPTQAPKAKVSNPEKKAAYVWRSILLKIMLRFDVTN